MTRAAHIERRADRAGLHLRAGLADALAVYLDVLALWNRKINLTALPLEPATDEAIDRIIVEPLAAARQIRPEDRSVVDIGSGGGSPALPLRLACAGMRMILVEVKSRKAAFLRAAARELALDDVEIENRAFSAVAARPEFVGQIDLVTVRAVRIDADLARGVAALLQPRGRMFRFAAHSDAGSIGLNADAWSVQAIPLVGTSVLEIQERRSG